MEKVKYFYNAQKLVHISYKNNKWKRGMIIDCGDEAMFTLHELVDGEIPVFLEEIFDIQPLRPAP